jgi:hypothetical protein
MPLAGISQRDVRAWVAELSARSLAPATVQNAYQLLGKVMGRGRGCGHVGPVALSAGTAAQGAAGGDEVAEILTEV